MTATPARTEEVTIDRRPGVYLANVNPGAVSHRFARSLVDLVRADIGNGWGVWRGILWGESGANVSKTRNELVRMFLDNHPDGEWLLFVDSDMVFPQDVIVRLLGAAAKAQTKMVGGCCVMVGELGPVPTLYQFDDVPGSDGFTRVQFDYPDNSLLQVAATGAACLMIHREVLEAVREAAGGHNFGWFAEMVVSHGGTRHWVSEDISFCVKAGELGYSTYVDCTLEIGHHKHGRVWYPSDIRTGTGAPRSPVVAVVPVKDRLDLTRTLVEQVRAQGGCDEIVVADNGSGADTKEWLAAQGDVTVLDMPDAGIHAMWNAGAQRALDRWGARVRVAFLNNDLRLGPAFLRALSQALTDDRDYTVVGGNYDGRRADVPVVAVSDICAGRYDGTGGLPGFAFMVRGEWFSGGYRFPEACRWWFGDNDLLRHLAYADAHSAISGFRAGIVIAAEVEHLGDGAQTAGAWADPKWAEQLEADRAAYEAKWAKIDGAARARASIAAGDLTPFYTRLRETPSDINEHLETLHDLAVKLDAKTVIELGVRGGRSTIAWLVALHTRTGGRLWAVDVDPAPPALAAHPAMTFTQGHDLDPFVLAQLPADGVDIVFVDTSHEYEQAKAEIQAYAPRVRPGGAMVFHDVAVEVHEHHGPGSQPPFPVRKAVEEWAERDGLAVDWYGHNNGLAVVWAA